jgi:uncharacterized membrane protein YvbJ
MFSVPLIKCFECGKEVPKALFVCPSCDAPLTAEQRVRQKSIQGFQDSINIKNHKVLVVILVCVFIAWLIVQWVVFIKQ